MTLQARLTSLERHAARSSGRPIGLWLDWSEGGDVVQIDGVTYSRSPDETARQLVERAVAEAQRTHPDCRLTVFSWIAPDAVRTD